MAAVTRDAGDPVWLGAFTLATGHDCDACPSGATSQCAWIWRGRLAVLRLCATCSEVASSVRTGAGFRFTPPPDRPSDVARVEMPASALQLDIIARAHAERYL